MEVNLKYDRLVERGIEILGNIKTAKYDICELTLKVCDIQYGGHHVTKDLYSIPKYAKDIGMSHHTLSKWLEEHRNVVKKLKNKPKPEDFKIIRQVMKEVTNRNTVSEVRMVYEKYESYTNNDMKLLSIIKNAKTVRNFLQDNKLSSFKEEDINIMINLVEEMNHAIGEQL